MSELQSSIESFFEGIKETAQVISPIFAFLGVLGLGLMYMGSSWPILGDWKKNNPQAASSVVMGLVFILLASSVASFISFT